MAHVFVFYFLVFGAVLQLSAVREFMASTGTRFHLWKRPSDETLMAFRDSKSWHQYATGQWVHVLLALSLMVMAFAKFAA